MRKIFLAGIILAAGIFTGCGNDPPPPPPPAEKTESKPVEEKSAQNSADDLKAKQDLKRYVLAIQPYLDHVKANWQDPTDENRADFNELSKSERHELIWKNMKLLEHNANLSGEMIKQLNQIDTPKAAEELKNTLYAINNFYFKALNEYMDYFSGSEEERHSVSGVASSLLKIASMSSSSELDRLIKKRDEIINSVRDVEVDTADIPKPEKIADSVFDAQPAKPDYMSNIPEDPETEPMTREEIAIESQAAAPLQEFHSSITSRNFQRAFECFSSERQSKINFDDWVAGFENTVSSEANYIQMKSYDDEHVVLNYILFATDKPNIVRRFEGEATMVFEDGKWKIDRAVNTLIDD